MWQPAYYSLVKCAAPQCISLCPHRRAGGSADERSSKEPKTFKRFLMEDVPDSVTPLEAQRLYEQYLTGHFGDQLRARFEQEKTVDV